MTIDLERRTLIIPVKKINPNISESYRKYILEVSDIIWNEIQILILEGGIKKKMTVEFKIEEVNE